MSATSHTPEPQALILEDVCAPVPPASKPSTFWTVRRVRGLALAAIILAVAVSLLSAYIAASVAEQAHAEQQRTEQRLVELEEYVAGKGEQRDADTERLDERIDNAVCGFLDFLAPGVTTDRIRGAYGCGPHPNPATPPLGPEGAP